MYVAIVGYGRMGKLVREVFVERDHTVVSTVDPEEASADHRRIAARALRDAEVCICFTRPSVAVENIRQIARCGKSMVIGTTGWYDRMDEARRLVDAAGVGLLYSANFSLGVNICVKCVEITAEVMNRFEDYDVFVTERHHRGKVDSPSGTARELGNILLRKLQRKRTIVTECLNRRIGKEELHVSSVRGGAVPGSHWVTYDSEVDTIELCHEARSRKGFAVGAVRAAEWIVKTKRKGMITKEEMLEDILK